MGLAATAAQTCSKLTNIGGRGRAWLPRPPTPNPSSFRITGDTNIIFIYKQLLLKRYLNIHCFLIAEQIAVESEKNEFKWKIKR